MGYKETRLCSEWGRRFLDADFARLGHGGNGCARDVLTVEVNEGVLASSVDLVVKDDGEAGDGDRPMRSARSLATEKAVSDASLRRRCPMKLSSAFHRIQLALHSEFASHSGCFGCERDGISSQATVAGTSSWRRTDDDPAPPVRMRCVGRFATFGPSTTRSRGRARIGDWPPEETKGRCGHGELPGSG